MPSNTGSKKANPWGLHDMQGNVWEWVQDWHGPHPAGETRDPRGPDTGETKVFKGGSWLNWGLDKAEVRPSYRDHRKPGFRHTDLGFRLVRTPSMRHAVRAGGTLYVAASEGAAGTVEQQMQACRRALEANGFTLSEVVSSQIWVTDIRRAPEASRSFRNQFGGTPPAATISEVTALPAGATEDFALVAAKGARKAIRRGPKHSFSPAILAGGALYISGQSSVEPATGAPVQGPIGAHVKKSLENIGAILRDAGLDFSHVAQASVILTNPADFAPMGDVYRTFTSQPRPARVPLGATRLPGDAPVSITMIAHTGKGSPVLPHGMDPSDNYSRGYLVDGTLYVAGIGSTQASLEDGMNDVLARVKAIVEAAKMSLGDVVEARVYLNDIRNFDAMDRGYRKHFGSDRQPARATVAVAKLPANLTVMASFVAVKSSQ
jgi:enamine deaminase RidA (YjgF/YER057c/UK114 family)